MAGITKGPRIIEFNGLPGSGKSYVAKILGNKLEKAGTTINYKYTKHSFQKYPYHVLTRPYLYYTIRQLKHYSKSFPDNKAFSSVLMPVYYLDMYERFLKGRDDGYLVIDEGIIQMLVSLAYQDPFTSSEQLRDILRKLKLDCLPVTIINCVCDFEVNYGRIKKRPYDGCRIDQLEDKEMRRTMMVQTRNFEYIRNIVTKELNSVRCINIDTSSSAEQCANQIIDSLV